MNHASNSYSAAPMPPAIYVWLVPSEEVQEQPGSWRIRKWDTEPFPEANFELSQPRGPSVPENPIGELKDIYTVARHVGIPGTKIDNFIKYAAMAGYVLVRATAINSTPATTGGNK